MSRSAKVFEVFCLSVLAMLIFSSPAWGLDPALKPGEYLMNTWTVTDGLCSDEIRCIAQTPDNYLWIGTAKGLTRFDGVKMEIIDPGFHKAAGAAYIARLYVDRRGSLWICTFFGLIQYKNNQFKSYGNNSGLPQKIPAYINEIENGKLVVSYLDDYIFYYHPGTDSFKRFTKAKHYDVEPVIKITEDSKGVVWVCSLRKGLYKLIGENFVKAGLNVPGGAGVVRDYIEHSSGDLLVGSAKGLIRMDMNTKKTELLTAENNGLSRGRILQILEDNHQTIWLATHEGLNRITRNQRDEKQVEVMLKAEDISGLFEDSEKNLWVGTDGAGIIRIKNPVIKTYTVADGLPNNRIHCLMTDSKGDIWIGTNTKLCRYRNQRFEIIPDDLYERRYALIEDQKGNIWEGGARGLVKNPATAPQRFTSKDGLPPYILFDLFSDSKNRLWIGTFKGFCRYDNGTFTTFTAADGLPGNFTTGFFEDKNHDILVTTLHGITRFPKGKLGATLQKELFWGETISFILPDKSSPDVLWVGTYRHGLKRFADGKWFSFAQAPGLEIKELYMAVEDAFGYFWFSGDKGILRIKKKELNAYAGGKSDWINTTAFTTGDGMLSRICAWSSSNSITKTRDGELWFATQRGICAIDPAKVRIDKRQPNVIIESVSVDKKIVGDINKINPVKYGSEIAFRFTAPTFASPGSTRFRYRLEGVDKKWHTLPLGDRRGVVYNELSAGKYRFRVIAINRFGGVNSSGASAAFEVLPPFYATFWFWGLILFVIGAGTGGGIFWFGKTYIRKPTPVTSYEKTKLDPVKSKKIIKKLKALMDIQKLYQDDNLSLKDLANKLHVTSHFLSQLLNDQLGVSFFDMVNGYRVEEVKERLSDPEDANTPVLTIAYDAGFSQKSSFNRYFKKMTGLTPSQFRKNNEH
ncbi:MAG: helix-turn-helix domain-containing protein [bacterium]|nr:helix-turn-helix domain-containing protein [bacterium]